MTRVDTTVIHNAFVDKTVLRYDDNVRTSYNGGHGGIQAQPNKDQVSSRKYGPAPTTVQKYHEDTSAQDCNKLATVNQGQPHTPAVSHLYSATNRPQHFTPVTDADRQEAQRHIA